MQQAQDFSDFRARMLQIGRELELQAEAKQDCAKFVAQYRDATQIEVIKQALDRIHQGQSFAFFPLNLSAAEYQAGRELQFNAGGTVEVSGELNFFPSRIIGRLQDWGANPPARCEIIAGAVSRLVASAVQAGNHETAVADARIAGNWWSNLRWHTDGKFFLERGNDSPQYRIAFALCGETTYVCDPPDDIRASFNQIQNEFGQLWNKSPAEFAASRQDIEVRLNRLLEDQPIINAETGVTGVIFKVGTLDSGIHSEPKAIGPRLLITINPCSFSEAAQCRAMHQLHKLMMPMV